MARAGGRVGGTHVLKIGCTLRSITQGYGYAATIEVLCAALQGNGWGEALAETCAARALASLTPRRTPPPDPPTPRRGERTRPPARRLPVVVSVVRGGDTTRGPPLTRCHRTLPPWRGAGGSWA